MLTTGEIVGLAEWIVDDTCLVCKGNQVQFPGSSTEPVEICKVFFQLEILA